jgi:predicted phage terminase large subunit-like protein
LGSSVAAKPPASPRYLAPGFRDLPLNSGNPASAYLGRLLVRQTARDRPDQRFPLLVVSRRKMRRSSYDTRPSFLLSGNRRCKRIGIYAFMRRGAAISTRVGASGRPRSRSRRARRAGSASSQRPPEASPSSPCVDSDSVTLKRNRLVTHDESVSFTTVINGRDCPRPVRPRVRWIRACGLWREVIEDKSSGIQLIQDLRNEGVHKIVEYKPPPGADKVMRLHACSDRFENGRVFLPRSAPWLDEYVTELVGFPGTKHDDQVDSTTQALDHLREPDVVAKFLKAFPPDGHTNTLLARRLGLC